MASEVTRARVRWGVVVAVAAGVALGGVLSERIEERRATRTEERASVKAQPEPSGPDCTDGVDCYCDKVADSGHAFYDPNALLCEDFEAITLHENVNFGGGAPLWGPWYDGTGYPAGWRGFNQYWTRTYGGVQADCDWRAPDPVNPILGDSCIGVCAGKEWRADDLWQGNDGACIDIIRNGEFDDEVATYVDPQVPGKHAGAFDGRQSFAYRVQAGRTSAILGARSFPAQYNLGVTMAVAYPIQTEGHAVWLGPWKHEEISAAVDGRHDAWIMFHNTTGVGIAESDPFNRLWMRWASGYTTTDCNNALTAATIRVGGTFECIPSALNFRPSPTVYQRSNDFPSGVWACVQAHIYNLNTSRMTHKIWVNSELILDYDIDTYFLNNKSGYNVYKYNSYANVNSGLGGYTPTTTVTHRYIDNVHLKAGAPVSCSQIGF